MYLHSLSATMTERQTSITDVKKFRICLLILFDNLNVYLYLIGETLLTEIQSLFKIILAINGGFLTISKCSSFPRTFSPCA